MKLNNPVRISILLAIAITLLSVISAYCYINNITSLVLSVVLFLLISLSILFFIIKQFIHERIRIIYKNIYRFKGTSKLQNLDIDTVEQEAKEWADQQEKQLQKLKTDENYRREFIGNVSHELKTPIFNIQGYVQTLIDGGIDAPEVNSKYLNRANKSVERMINIVEDLEVISKLETDTEQLLLDKFNILVLVQEAIDQLEIQAKKRNIHLKIVNEANTNFVLGDKHKIHQVFMNLISNSIKYGKDGGSTTIRLLDMDNNMMIEVADNGIGIDENSLDRLFERFYRVDKNRSRDIGGTGLGLAIVKHIIEAHHQTINVRSTKDVGSTFSFILEKS